MSNINLTLWGSVEKTPVEQTKPITGKTYKGNSPKPHHLIKRATETFGPCGIGWGFTVVEDKVVDTAIYPDGSVERMHYCRVRVWYMYGGQRGEIEHVGGTVLSGRRRGEKADYMLPFADDDAPKKSVTDALIKALSLIGFAGDIFLGRYDDSKYMAELRDEARAEKQAQVADPAPQSPPQRRQPPKAPAKHSAPDNGRARAGEAPTQPNDPIPFGEDGGEVLYVNTQGRDTPLDLADAVSRLEKAAEATTSLPDEEFAGLMNANAGWLTNRAPAALKALFNARNMDPADWLR